MEISASRFKIRRSDHGHVFRCEDAGNERFHAKDMKEAVITVKPSVSDL